MISEFEQRLAAVLGAQLPPPFQGRVAIAPGGSQGAGPRIIVGVQQIEPMIPDLGSQRPEVVPGGSDRRRVLRLTCLVSLEIYAAGNQGRSQQVQGLDAVLYLLDQPSFKTGQGLSNSADPGFLIQSMSIQTAQAPLNPDATHPVGLTLQATGWFWPIGIVGETGRAIGEVRVRGVTLPLALDPANPDIQAGGSPIPLALSLGGAVALRLNGSGMPLPSLPFGSLALTLRQPDGQPGTGTLSGGSSGAAGVHLIPLTNGVAQVNYTPPAEATIEELIVAIDNGAGDFSLEVGRYALAVRS